MKRLGARRLGGALGVLVLAAATFLVPLQNVPQAAAAWSAPKALEASAWLPFTSSPALGTTRGRGTVAVWTANSPTDDTERVRLRRITPTGGLGSLVTISPSPGTAGGLTVNNPKAAVDADGDVVVTWVAQDPASNRGWQVFARRLSRTGSLGPVRRVGIIGERGWNPTVAVDGQGRAVITWQTDIQIAVRFTLSSEIVGRFQVGDWTGHAAQVKATPVGNFLIPGRSIDGRAELTTLRWDGTRTKRTMDPTHESREVDADADANGRRFIAYTRDIVTPERTTSALFVRRLTSTGLTAQVRVSPTTHHVHYATIDTDSEGDSIVSWATGQTTFRFYLRQWRADGTLGPIRELGSLRAISGGGFTSVAYPGVAVDADGDAIVAGTDVYDTVWRRTITRSGTVSSATTLATEAGNATAVITHAGLARVVYHKGTGQMYLRTN